MISAVWLLLALLLSGAPLRSVDAFRERQEERELSAVFDRPDRYIDFGVVLHVVEHDPNGRELLEGKPPMRILRSHRLGGTVDTETRRIVGPSRDPQIWYCSADQEPIILHGDALPLGLLVYGSEGAGKSTCAAMWHYCRIVEHLGECREGGQVAPTRPRLKFVRDAMTALYPREWYTYRTAEDVFTFVDGSRVQLRAAKRQSGEGGSPIQGFNWSWCCGDEMQDMIDAHNDIESRGRSARGGQYKQLRTATAKDSSSWRTLRDMLTRTGAWHRSTLLGTRSPFIAAAFWAAKRTAMSDREYRRRVLAEDVGPERMLYFNWSRESVRPIPVGAKRITSQVLSAKTGNPAHALLVGHDPGVSKAASILLDAYRVPGSPDVLWWVRGELFTTNATTEQHGAQLLDKVQREYGYNQRGVPERMHVRADPYGSSEARPDRDVYLTFGRLGIDIKAAQYAKTGQGNGQIGREARIEMINRLLIDAAGTRRLFVEADEHGRPVAPRLVESLESLERDEGGRAERGRKDATDMTDCPAGLGYALWPWEKEAAGALRNSIREVE